MLPILTQKFYRRKKIFDDFELKIVRKLAWTTEAPEHHRIEIPVDFIGT